jgi:hypothetical protein
MSETAGKGVEKAQATQPKEQARSQSGSLPGGAYEAVHALHRAAGNRAVGSLLARGSGRPLNDSTREEMEARFGEDFSDVRVHAGGSAAISAAALHANAFTSGRDVVFGEGFYSPGTSRGKKLLAHELAHVVQQRRGGPNPRTFDPQNTAERDAAHAATQFSGKGTVSVAASSGVGVARQEADEPWWKKRLNPIYQRALEVLPKEAADKLELANEAARDLVKQTGATDQALDQAVQVAEPVLKPIAAYLGVKSDTPAAKTDNNTPVTWLGTPPIDVQLKQKKEQQAAQAALDKEAPGALAPPIRKPIVSDLPPLDVLLRPDPPPTDFEAKLKEGKPFQIKLHPKPEVDPRKAVWLGPRPSDEQMKGMLFQDVNDPSRNISVPSEEGYDLDVDGQSTMPIRDFKTHELRGYRVRHGESMYVLDRNGEILTSYGMERPLEHPAIDPIDVAMLAADLGPIAAKGLQAGGKAVLESLAKGGVREMGEAGGDEVSQALARQASDALKSGVSHPRDFPEIDLGLGPANDVHPGNLPELRAANDVLEDQNVIRLDDYRPQNIDVAQENALDIAEGQDFTNGPPLASAGRRGGRATPQVRLPGRSSGGRSAVGSTVADATRGAANSTTGVAADTGPTIARLGKDEIDELTSMWEQRLSAETDKARIKEIKSYIKALKNKSRINDWRQSEEEVAYVYSQIGGKGETAFQYTTEEGVTKTTKPDFVTHNLRGEVKNWEMTHIGSEEGAEQMLDNLARQIGARRRIAGFADQTVVLDLRGQKLTEDQLQAIGKTFAERTGLPPKNIQIITWGK